jgi:hypothetical protein
VSVSLFADRPTDRRSRSVQPIAKGGFLLDFAIYSISASAARREQCLPLGIKQRYISVVWLRSVRFDSVQLNLFYFILAAAADWVFFSFVRLSLGSISFSRISLSALSLQSFSPIFLSPFSVVSSLQRRFLLVLFDENASNGSIWIRLVRVVPTRVSSLLSDGFCFPSRRLTFDENGLNCSLLIRLVQGFPTLVSVSESDISLFPSRSFPFLASSPFSPGHFC